MTNMMPPAKHRQSPINAPNYSPPGNKHYRANGSNDCSPQLGLIRPSTECNHPSLLPILTASRKRVRWRIGRRNNINSGRAGCG